MMEAFVRECLALSGSHMIPATSYTIFNKISAFGR